MFSGGLPSITLWYNKNLMFRKIAGFYGAVTKERLPSETVHS